MDYETRVGKGTIVYFETLGIVPSEVRLSVERLGGANYIPVIYGLEEFWEDEKNLYYFDNHVENAVVTFGLHDSWTMKRAWEKEYTRKVKKTLMEKFSDSSESYAEEDITILTPKVKETLLSLVYESKANAAVLGWIDILGLGEEYRINVPDIAKDDNWSVRLPLDCIVENFVVSTGENNTHSSLIAEDAINLILYLTKKSSRY